MATYTDKYTKNALTGKDVGIVFGKIHEGVTVTWSSGATFTVSPTTYGPFYPRQSYSDSFTATTDDITVYDDGVAVTVSAFTPSTGVGTMGSSPTGGSTITADVVEQQELYIAQNAKLTPKTEDEKLDQLRNPVQRKTFGNTEFTLKADFKVADLETLKLIFEETTTTGVYEFPSTPPTIYCAVLLEDENDALTGIIYCEDVYAQFDDILSAKAGKDAVENGFELTFGSMPILVDVAEKV